MNFVLPFGGICIQPTPERKVYKLFPPKVWWHSWQTPRWYVTDVTSITPQAGKSSVSASDERLGCGWGGLNWPKRWKFSEKKQQQKSTHGLNKNIPDDSANVPSLGWWVYVTPSKVVGDLQRSGMKRSRNWITWSAFKVFDVVFFHGHISPDVHFCKNVWELHTLRNISWSQQAFQKLVVPFGWLSTVP